VNLGPLIPIVLIVAVFYLLIIAPQRRRQRQAVEMSSRLEPGVKVMTTAGMFATVTEVTENEVHLEIAPGVVASFVKAAIGRVIPPEEPSEDHRGTDDAGGPSAS
jgi:preprotein translocase subunit YajC